MRVFLRRVCADLGFSITETVDRKVRIEARVCDVPVISIGRGIYAY
jgi:hypothetical protein